MGFRATTPHSAAGLRVEPPVSEPKALPGMDQTVNYNFSKHHFESNLYYFWNSFGMDNEHAHEYDCVPSQVAGE